MARNEGEQIALNEQVIQATTIARMLELKLASIRAKYYIDSITEKEKLYNIERALLDIQTEIVNLIE